MSCRSGDGSSESEAEDDAVIHNGDATLLSRALGPVHSDNGGIGRRPDSPAEVAGGARSSLGGRGAGNVDTHSSVPRIDLAGAQQTSGVVAAGGTAITRRRTSSETDEVLGAVISPDLMDAPLSGRKPLPSARPMSARWKGVQTQAFLIPFPQQSFTLTTKYAQMHISCFLT